MYCTACELEVFDSAHYKTELHGVNSKRKLNGFPPLTQEELDSKIDCGEVEQASEVVEEAIKPRKPKYNKKCPFCDEHVSALHYKEHGLSDEQVYCFEKKQCYVCYEKFSRISDLIQHLEADQHRKAVTDGVALYLENGKKLNPSNTQIPLKKVVLRSHQQETEAKKPVDKVAEKTQEDRRVQQLKISVEMNGRWGKWIH